MVITITMKSVIKRSETYYFRIGVPTDCRDSVGKREITQSLQTNEAGKAKPLAKALTADWKQKFKDIRNASSTPSPIIKSKTDDIVVSKLSVELSNESAKKSDKLPVLSELLKKLEGKVPQEVLEQL